MPLKSVLEWWSQVRSSLWFVPSICVVLGVALSVVLPEIDRYLTGQDWEAPSWLFSGSASGARSILSTVAGSLVTIVGVLFSITILVLQQASNRYTPRVMGNFMRQTGTQLTLGVFLATFLYALLVLRNVRGDESPTAPFVPSLSVTFSVLMAAICLGFLVYFIHHMASSLQASSIIANVHREFQQDIGTLYPEHVGEPVEGADEPFSTFRSKHMSDPILAITADSSGYLRSVDDQSIVSSLPGPAAVAILPKIGDFIISGNRIVEVSTSGNVNEEQVKDISSGLMLGRERSRYQDPLFDIRQLVDIALIALSPGINDPTTANNAISTLGATVADLASRSFPDRVRVLRQPDSADRGEIVIWLNRPTFSDYVTAAFSEIRRQATTHVAVTANLLATIGSVGASVTLVGRAEPLHREIDEVLAALEKTEFSEWDMQLLRAYAEEARRQLPIRRPSGPGST